jgi:hypothetical protein
VCAARGSKCGSARHLDEAASRIVLQCLRIDVATRRVRRGCVRIHNRSSVGEQMPTQDRASVKTRCCRADYAWCSRVEMARVP